MDISRQLTLSADSDYTISTFEHTFRRVYSIGAFHLHIMTHRHRFGARIWFRHRRHFQLPYWRDSCAGLAGFSMTANVHLLFG